MLDDLRSLFDGFTAAEEWFAGAASILAFLAFLVEFVRGRATTTSFRPLIGWMIALFGVVATGAAAHALSARSSPAWSAENRVLTVTFILGALMVCAGGLAVALAPSADRTRFRKIATAVEASVHKSGLVGSIYVPQGPCAPVLVGSGRAGRSHCAD